MEPRDHGVEHEADVRPGRGELSPVRALFASIWCICEGPQRSLARWPVSSANSAIRSRVEGRDAGPHNLPHQTPQTNSDGLLAMRGRARLPRMRRALKRFTPRDRRHCGLRLSYPPGNRWVTLVLENADRTHAATASRRHRVSRTVRQVGEQPGAAATVQSGAPASAAPSYCGIEPTP